MKWNTGFTRTFSCRLPIMGAPMLGPSGGHLAAETCRAGGLGFLAAGHLNSKEALHSLEREIEIFKEVSNDEEFPLCIGFIGHSTFATEQGWSLFENVLEDYSPKAIQVFAPAISYMKNNGTKTSVVKLAHSYGCKVIAQVGCEDDGVQALEEGVDCVIAQGTEAGGHGVRREHGCGTLSLTSRLVKRSNGKTPVLAAGGIVDGSGLTAALSLGADGVVLGTRLWASNEAKGPSAYKDSMVAAKSADEIVRTEAFDVIWNAYRDTKWPAPFDSSGVLRNKLTDTWDEKISDLRIEVESEDSKVVEEFKDRSAAQDTDFSCVFSGKGVASIDSIEPAFDIITNIEKEAIESLQRVNMVAQAE
mmetsp:Transcript_18999/g.47056  ORF Transcript_18999/g.47056 Transcript_18999/m.47056 type:complete len:361 (-) Transcript_18999:75-1157(-)